MHQDRMERVAMIVRGTSCTWRLAWSRPFSPVTAARRGDMYQPMIPQIYKVLTRGEGFLAVMARPRSGEWLRGEIAGLSRIGVTTMASLLEPGEEWELGLTSERAVAEELGLAFLSFPIPDRGVPTATQHFHKFSARLAADVRAGRGVVVHCRAGIGRSGVAAAAVLVALGHEPGEVFPMLSKARGVSVPDTDEQIEWFLKNCGGAPHGP